MHSNRFIEEIYRLKQVIRRKARFFQYCLLFPSFIFCFCSCADLEEFDNNPQGNLESLWKIMDENYCFFEYKGIDWDKVHDDYAGRIKNDMSNESLFYLLSEMLAEVKDGHVNLVSPFEVSRYDSWYQDSVVNFNINLLKEPRYLGRDYSVASGMKYKILDDNVGYIYYESFSNDIGEGNLDYVIKKFDPCHGIIIDIRDNGGGALNNVDVLAARFTNQKVLVGYIQHKTGKGHNDFSDPYPRYLEPTTRLAFQKPVVVLTSRQCYSAANDFVNAMKQLPNVCIIGTTTGGGGGFPFSSELPNGWSVRFSTSPISGPDYQSIENGVTPDIYQVLEPNKNTDSVIERARAYIKEKAGY